MFLVSTQKTSGGGRVKSASLLLFFTFVLLSAKGFSLPKDSTKSKYDLNDPRNPNCPCHRYQKQAENEYKQLRGNFGDNNINDNVGNKMGRESGNGFEAEEMGFGLARITMSMFKRTKVNGSETGESKKAASHGVRKEVFAFTYIKMKFPSSKTHKVKHRKMKGRFSDRLSRCFHF